MNKKQKKDFNTEEKDYFFKFDSKEEWLNFPLRKMLIASLGLFEDKDETTGKSILRKKAPEKEDNNDR